MTMAFKAAVSGLVASLATLLVLMIVVGALNRLLDAVSFLFMGVIAVSVGLLTARGVGRA